MMKTKYDEERARPDDTDDILDLIDELQEIRDELFDIECELFDKRTKMVKPLYDEANGTDVPPERQAKLRELIDDIESEIEEERRSKSEPLEARRSVLRAEVGALRKKQSQTPEASHEEDNSPSSFSP